MNFKRILVFGILFVILISYYYFFEVKKIYQEKETQKKARQLLNLEKGEEIVSLKIESKKGTSYLTKMEGVWHLVEPVQYAAEQLIVEGLAQALKVGIRMENIDSSKLNLSDFGLNPPDLRVGLKTKNIDKWRYINFGEKAPVGAFIYAKWEEETSIFLIDERIKQSFDKSAYSLRKKLIFNFDPYEITHCQVQLPHTAFELEKREQDWFLLKPEEIELAPAQVLKYLNIIRNIYAQEFLDNQDWQDKEFGLKNTKYFINLTGEKEKISFFIGKKFKNRDAYYGYVLNQGPLILLKDSIIENELNKEVIFFRKESPSEPEKQNEP